MNKLKVVGLGALNIDHIYKVARILGDGEAVIEGASSFPGGSAANTIYGLGKLGVDAGFIGAIGGDADGQILLDDFKKVGVDTGQIKVKPEASTGQVLALSDKRGRRSLYVLPGANSLLAIKDIDSSYINGAEMLHLSSLAGDKQFKLSLKLVEKMDSRVKLSFAPGSLYASRGLEALAPIIKRSHILFINQDEIKQLTGEESIIEGAAKCIKEGCQNVVVTLGSGKRLGTRLEIPTESGRRRASIIAYIKDSEKEYVISVKPRYKVPIADTTGAGDAFACGFLYGLVNNKDLYECGRLGNIVAQLCISKTGAREGLPTLKELARRYLELYQKAL